MSEVIKYIYTNMNKEFITGSVVFFTFVYSINYILNEFFQEPDEKTNNKKKDKTEQEHPKQEHPEVLKNDNTDIQMVPIESTSANSVSAINDGKLLDNVLQPMIDIIECNVNNELLPLEAIIDRKYHLLHLNERLSLIKQHLQEIKTELSK